MADADVKKSWYVLRAISGKEAKVKEVLDAAIKNTDLGLYVEQVLIPTQKVFTSRNGKKVIKEKNLFPGYVFVQAQLTGEVQYELRNTTNVIDFLRGRAKNSDPMPLREAEVNRMLGVADESLVTGLRFDELLGADRYDGFIKPHNHFICRECGMVEDMEYISCDELILQACGLFPGLVEDYELQFFGKCKNCLSGQ